jgi:hypothetical protein
VIKRDFPNLLAANTMAFAQLTGLDFEPSMAAHEHARVMGNDTAAEELAWFRSADRADPKAWIEVALGRTDILYAARPSEEKHATLLSPYIVGAGTVWLPSRSRNWN